MRVYILLYLDMYVLDDTFDEIVLTNRILYFDLATEIAPFDILRRDSFLLL